MLLHAEFKDVLSIDSESISSASGYDAFLRFVDRWSEKVKTFRRYQNARNMLYFTCLDFPPAYRRMLSLYHELDRAS